MLKEWIIWSASSPSQFVNRSRQMMLVWCILSSAMALSLIAYSCYEIAFNTKGRIDLARSAKN